MFYVFLEVLPLKHQYIPKLLFNENALIRLCKHFAILCFISYQQVVSKNFLICLPEGHGFDPRPVSFNKILFVQPGHSIVIDMLIYGFLGLELFASGLI